MASCLTMGEFLPPLSPRNEEVEYVAGVRTSTPISGSSTCNRSRSSSLLDDEVEGIEEAENSNDESEVSGRSSSQ